MQYKLIQVKSQVFRHFFEHLRVTLANDLSKAISPRDNMCQGVCHNDYLLNTFINYLITFIYFYYQNHIRSFHQMKN